MSFIQKVLLKLKIETQFLLQQKWGWRKTSDPHAIPKYLLKKYLPFNPVIIDCGAHIGADSVELAKIFPGAIIHSFEPVPHLHQSLLSNTKKYSNISCYQCALSNQNGEAIFFVSSGESDASSSLLEPTGHIMEHPGTVFKEKIIVNTITLDGWAAANNLQTIDFLWLDMQGFELQMLKASQKIIDTVKVIHTEVSIKDSYKDVVNYAGYKSWMETKGFMVAIEAIPTNTDMGNVLFVRK